MSAQEFQEWQAFDSIDPIGLDRLDWLFATLTSAVVGMLATKGPRPTAKDCLPIWDEQEARRRQIRKMKIAQLEAQLRARSNGHG